MNSAVSISNAANEAVDEAVIDDRRTAAAWLVPFVIVQLLCQVGSVIGPAPLRFPIRLIACAASLAMLFVCGGSGKPHPARIAAMAILGLLIISLANPSGNTFWAQFAQIGFYAAAISPVFWVGRSTLTAQNFRNLLIAFWIFHVVSSGVGLLQALRPGRLQPALSRALVAHGPEYLESLKVLEPNGELAFRPMGLSDQPGGAATAGMLTVLLSLGLVLTASSGLLRAVSLSGIALGFACLYVSHSRSMHVMTAVCLIGFCAMLAFRGELTARHLLLALAPAMIVLSLVLAISETGGQAFRTTVSRSTEDSFWASLSQDPLGAGLGRWGIAQQVLGHPHDRRSTALDIENQWAGWQVDGGLPLVVAYAIAIGIVFRWAWRIAADTGREQFAIWGVLLLVCNLAAVAGTFGHPIFIGLYGLEFWILNAALLSAYHANGYRPEPRKARPASSVKRFRHAIGRGLIHSTGFEDDDLPVTNVPTLVTAVVDPEIAPNGVFMAANPITVPQPPQRAAVTPVVIARRGETPAPLPGSPPAAPAEPHSTFDAVARQLSAQLHKQAASQEALPGPFADDAIFARPANSPAPRGMLAEDGLVGDAADDLPGTTQPDD